MRTVSIIRGGEGLRIHLPADMAYDRVDELELSGRGNDYPATRQARLVIAGRFTQGG